MNSRTLILCNAFHRPVYKIHMVHHAATVARNNTVMPVKENLEKTPYIWLQFNFPRSAKSIIAVAVKVLLRGELRARIIIEGYRDEDNLVIAF